MEIYDFISNDISLISKEILAFAYVHLNDDTNQSI